ncbi:MAG: NAD(P)/FAD-dependent oxidoreductase [Chthoniobacterales bacterium]
MTAHHDVIVLGGGAAGLLCAATAGQRGRRVLVLEHNDRVGKKIVISGGGRCNFTNINAAPDNYLSANPDFCRSALARYTPEDFRALVARHGIGWHEKKLGQLFCNTSSRDVVTLLLDECAQARVDVRCGVRVESVTKPDRFCVGTDAGEFTSDTLVVATGGLSFAKLGASDLGYRVAREFGLRLTEIRPGLVPLTFGEADRAVYGPLSGVSLPVRIRRGNTTFDEALLFTHRGLSGPAILQISSYWREGETLHLDLLPGGDGLPAPGRGPAIAQLSAVWPKRFAEVWCARHTPSKTVAQWTAREREHTGELLRHWPFDPAGTEGYPKAEVTLGGVDTRDLSSKTMEARAVPGLYFIGEVVDVTGWLGGYNFQWAWASAHAAGQTV